MEDKKENDTYIKDSNVEILISSGETLPVQAAAAKTDYWSMGIIALIMLSVAAYAFLTRIGIL